MTWENITYKRKIQCKNVYCKLIYKFILTAKRYLFTTATEEGISERLDGGKFYQKFSQSLRVQYHP